MLTVTLVLVFSTALGLAVAGGLLTFLFTLMTPKRSAADGWFDAAPAGAGGRLEMATSVSDLRVS